MKNLILGLILFSTNAFGVTEFRPMVFKSNVTIGAASGAVYVSGGLVKSTAFGTSGYVLTSTGNNQLWAAPAAGATTLTGDVTGTGVGSVVTAVGTVGGKTSGAIATSVSDTQAATNLNTPSTIVKRDASGNFSAGTITAALIGAVTGNVLGNVTGNVSGTATGISGVLPIVNGGTGQTTASAAFNALSPITTIGDIILGTGSNAAGRLAIGSNGQVLTVSGTTAVWAASSGGSSGAVNYTIATKTVSGTVLTTDQVLLCDTTSGSVTMTLPTAVGNDGKRFIFKKIAAANTLTISGTVGQTIDWQNTQSTNVKGSSIVIFSNGSNWLIE